MVPAEVWERTFQLWAGARSRVCFAVDVDGRQYAVTAAHVVAGVDADDLRITRNGSHEPFGATRVWTSARADVAVISLDRLLAPPHLTLPLSMHGLVYGQQVHFLGFPFGLIWPMRLHQGQPVPLVKHAIVSGELEIAADHTILLLDGHNNEGFSGGPVVGAPGEHGKVQAIGVVSGYQAMNTSVVDPSGTPIGTVLANTGLMLVEHIDHALEGARQLGDGYLLPSDLGT